MPFFQIFALTAWEMYWVMREIIYIHLYSPMNGRKNAKQYKNNAVTLTILKYSATVIEHI